MTVKLNHTVEGQIKVLSPNEVYANVEKLRIIDVRRQEEFVGEYGHVRGAELVTLGDKLHKLLEAGNRDEAIVFICHSGGRSGQATQFSQQLGYTQTYNMSGGMLKWNELHFPIEK
jgi:rhodanese-related sulfurtransferase